MENIAMGRPMTTKEAAEYLRVHELTLIKMARQGHFGRKMGKSWRFRLSDLDRYLAGDIVSDSNRGASNEQVQAGNR
jgi:excisionase family DNA binding protein